uniref:DNA 5'-3' helicase n=1 Tax=Polysiphonia scopulorum TaxID=257860 RepID=A0A1Z1MIK1_9FLOR|nr:Replication helicase subunit [Polysiphonia scopulorum]ARW65672.1 Replication helicase subunit [Polysiphonia scopulorum]
MNKLYQHQFLPQNYVAEETLIGILLIYPNILNTIKNIIKIEYFFLEKNQLIYLNLMQIIQQEHTNIVEIIYELQYRQLLNKLGGLQKIMKAMKQSQIFICSNKLYNYIEELINILKNNYLKRLIIQFGYNLIKISHLNNISNKYLYTKTLTYINKVENLIINTNNNEIINIKELISKKLLNIKYDTGYNNERKRLITSGLIKLDKIINTLPQSSLIIIAGRPSIGKTSLAINIAYNAFFDQQINLIIFSLEMNSQEIFNKLICIGSKANINNPKVFNEKQWNQISRICNRLLRNNIHISDQSNIDIHSIENTTKNIKKKHQIDLLIIDYLQLIEFSIDKHKNYNRSQELGYITRRLKLLAQSTKSSIIVISQLNRNIETRNEKEPLLSDLKESGCIAVNNNISIFSKNKNEINISNIKIQNKNILSVQVSNRKKKILINNRKYLNILGNINIFQEYIFKYVIKQRIFKLTYSHEYLNYNNWIKANKILRLTTINSTNCIEAYKLYINQINFIKYLKSYDINQNSHFNIICSSIILHNSIEQDADIVMILYKKEDMNKHKELNEKTIIDLKISKNRNGKTGQCTLEFIPKVSIFKDANITI